MTVEAVVDAGVVEAVLAWVGEALNAVEVVDVALVGAGLGTVALVTPPPGGTKVTGR
jgi:hypothetical protein